MSEEKKPPEDDGDEYRLADGPSKEEPGDAGYELAAREDAAPEPAASEFLEVETPPRGPPLPPTAPPFPARNEESEEERRREEEEEFDDSPPRLRPFEALKFLAWPFRHGNADDFLIALFTILVILLGGWFLGRIPIVGGALQALVALATAVYFFTYLVKVAHAAAEGRRTPSVWVQPGRGEAEMSQGIRATILLVACGLPAIVVGFATQSEWWAFPFALLAWVVFPAALLNLAASGGMAAANPIDVMRTALVRRRLYFRITLPGLVFVLALFVSSGWLSGVWFGLAMWLTLVYTALAVGLLAFHDERLTARVADLSGMLQEPENDTGRGFEDESE